MTMPVLPVVQPPPAPIGARQDESPSTATEDGMFARVLSQERQALPASPLDRPAHPSDSTQPKAGPGPEKPARPEETLALLLDASALPWVQAQGTSQASSQESPGAQTGTIGHQGHQGASDADVTTSDATIPEDPANNPSLAIGADPRATATPIAHGNHPHTDGPANLPAAAATGRTTPKGANQPIDTRATPPLAAARPDHPSTPATPADPTGDESPHGRQDTSHTRPLVASADAVTTAVNQVVGTPALARGPSAEGLNVQTAGLRAADAPNLPAMAWQPQIGSLTGPGQVALATPLASPNWPADLSRQMLALIQTHPATNQVVHMQVNPPELGPVHITLHVSDSLAQAAFVSPHAHVRHVLENALPHLEQQLSQAGLSLGQTSVSDQQAGQQWAEWAAQAALAQAQPARRTSTTASAAAVPGIGPAGMDPMAQRRGTPDSLVDTFA